MGNKVRLRLNFTNVDLQKRPSFITISSLVVPIYTASFNTKALHFIDSVYLVQYNYFIKEPLFPRTIITN